MIRTESRFSLLARIVLMLSLTLTPAAPAFAQQAPAKQDVTIVIQQQQVRFTTPQPVEQMHLQVRDQAGEVVFDSGATSVLEIYWPLQQAGGAALKSGLYAYTLTLKEAGKEAQVRRGHFIVDRAQDREGADKLWVTSQNAGVGTELTVARDENAIVAGTTTSNERTLPQRGESQSRGNNERGIEAEAKNQPLEAKTSTVAAASGTAGRLAKFTTATDLGNSVMTELNGNIGIGMTNPERKLDVAGGLRVVVAPGTNNNGEVIFGTPNTEAGMSITKDGGRGDVRFDGATLSLMARGADYGGPPAQGLVIRNNGNVGIGTITPAHKLDVNGGIRAVFNNSTGMVAQTTGGTNAWARFHMNTPRQRWFIGTSNNFNGDQFYLWDETHAQPRFTIQPNGGAIAFPLGNVGIGTTNPEAKLQVDSDGFTSVLGKATAITGLTHGVRGETYSWSNFAAGAVGVAFAPSGITYGVYGETRSNTSGAAAVIGRAKTIDSVGGHFVNDAGGTALRVEGRAAVDVLEIRGGADFAENFDVNVAETSAEGPLEKVEAGLVVSIDPASPGKLMLSTQAYDRRVAGIISGAGGVKPGMMMSQPGTLADGQHPVALSGRVYCWVDATRGAIKPGDMLTTSPTPGHAMKVVNAARAQGAIIGKAMTGLKSGKGLVLVLVTLQ